MLLTDIANPWAFARYLFEPAAANPGKPFQRLSDWRARLGVACIVWLSLPDAGVRFIFWKVVTNASFSIAAGAAFAAAVAGIYWLITPKPVAPATSAYAAATVRRALLSIGITIAMGVVARIGIVGFPVLGWLLGLWMVAFGLAMLWFCLRWMFGVSNVNDLLGPIVTAMTAVTAFAIDKIVTTEADPRPQSIQDLIDYGGLATVLTLALIEYIVIVRTGGHAPRPYPRPYGHYGPQPTPWRQEQPTAPLNALSIVAISTFLFCWPVSIILAVLALQQINRTGERGRGLAIIALALNAIFLPLFCLLAAWRIRQDGGLT
ncbi:DUF4190 domain-containing protein [Actinoplanes sp. NPDC026619]|uniref:DUF4190 domain-containing protein n=1 Tax=Actinoplanes sp. NPDC026619 TaxID=3155798 RepID=UPI0033CB6122